MNQVAVIADALISHRAVLALPRWRVLSDVRARFHCGDSTAREAYALARTEAHVRARGNTVTHAKRERA